MSHAWDGFRMTTSTLHDAMDVVDAFRPVAMRMLHEWNARLLADAATTLLDTACARGLAPPARPLSTAWSTIQDRRLRIVRSEERDPRVDPEFRLTLLRHEGAVYGLVHTEQQTWRQAWLDQQEIADYSWWTGEPPEHLDAAEWDRREEAWKAMLPDMWPAGHGVVVILTPRYFESAPDDVLAALPDMETRRRRTATELALSSRMSHMVEGSEEAIDVVAAASRVACWMGTDEGVAERDRLMENLDLPMVDLAALLGSDPEKDMPERQKEA